MSEGGTGGVGGESSSINDKVDSKSSRPKKVPKRKGNLVTNRIKEEYDYEYMEVGHAAAARNQKASERCAKIIQPGLESIERHRYLDEGIDLEYYCKFWDEPKRRWVSHFLLTPDSISSYWDRHPKAFKMYEHRARLFEENWLKEKYGDDAGKEERDGEAATTQENNALIELLMLAAEKETARLHLTNADLERQKADQEAAIERIKAIRQKLMTDSISHDEARREVGEVKSALDNSLDSTLKTPTKPRMKICDVLMHIKITMTAEDLEEGFRFRNRVRATQHPIPKSVWICKGKGRKPRRLDDPHRNAKTAVEFVELHVKRVSNVGFEYLLNLPPVHNFNPRSRRKIVFHTRFLRGSRVLTQFARPTGKSVNFGRIKSPRKTEATDGEWQMAKCIAIMFLFDYHDEFYQRIKAGDKEPESDAEEDDEDADVDVEGMSSEEEFIPRYMGRLCPPEVYSESEPEEESSEDDSTSSGWELEDGQEEEEKNYDEEFVESKKKEVGPCFACPFCYAPFDTEMLFIIHLESNHLSAPDSAEMTAKKREFEQCIEELLRSVRRMSEVIEPFLDVLNLPIILELRVAIQTLNYIVDTFVERILTICPFEVKGGFMTIFTTMISVKEAALLIDPHNVDLKSFTTAAKQFLTAKWKAKRIRDEIEKLGADPLYVKRMMALEGMKIDEIEGPEHDEEGERPNSEEIDDHDDYYYTGVVGPRTPPEPCDWAPPIIPDVDLKIESTEATLAFFKSIKRSKFEGAEFWSMDQYAQRREMMPDTAESLAFKVCVNSTKEMIRFRMPKWRPMSIMKNMYRSATGVNLSETKFVTEGGEIVQDYHTLDFYGEKALHKGSIIQAVHNQGGSSSEGKADCKPDRNKGSRIVLRFVRWDNGKTTRSEEVRIALWSRVRLDAVFNMAIDSFKTVKLHKYASVFGKKGRRICPRNTAESADLHHNDVLDVYEGPHCFISVYNKLNVRTAAEYKEYRERKHIAPGAHFVEPPVDVTARAAGRRIALHFRKWSVHNPCWKDEPVILTFKSTDKFEAWFWQYALEQKQKGTEHLLYNFVWAGRDLMGDDAPERLHMRNGDAIDVFENDVDGDADEQMCIYYAGPKAIEQFTDTKIKTLVKAVKTSNDEAIEKDSGKVQRDKISIKMIATKYNGVAVHWNMLFSAKDHALDDVFKRYARQLFRDPRSCTFMFKDKKLSLRRTPVESGMSMTEQNIVRVYTDEDFSKVAQVKYMMEVEERDNRPIGIIDEFETEPESEPEGEDTWMLTIRDEFREWQFRVSPYMKMNKLVSKYGIQRANAGHDLSVLDLHIVNGKSGLCPGNDDYTVASCGIKKGDVIQAEWHPPCESGSDTDSELESFPFAYAKTSLTNCVADSSSKLEQMYAEAQKLRKIASSKKGKDAEDDTVKLRRLEKQIRSAERTKFFVANQLLRLERKNAEKEKQEKEEKGKKKTNGAAKK